MTSSNEQFQASVIAGIETPGSDQAAKVFAELLRLTDGLEGQAKKAGAELVKAFQAGKKPEELATQIRILQREIRFLNTVSSGTDLFKNDQVQKANALQTAINNAAKAFDSLRQSEALSRYELGLESKTITEAARSMSILEKNLKAVDLALQNNAGNAALQQKQKLLQDNKALLEVVIGDMKRQGEQDRLNEQIAKENWASAKQRFAEVQRITRQRREQEGSAESIRSINNAQMNYSALGRNLASQQGRIRVASAQASTLPGQEDIALQRIQDATSRGYLSQVYRDAGMAPTAISATLRDGPKVRALVAEIKDIESKLVAERAKGNIDLQSEVRLLGEVRSRMQQIENTRYDQNLNDPQRRAARQDSQARNMLNRAGGEGGAALLAVQASLMANYSILNSTVGAMKAAVVTSVELEAAFRNVQAVTGTTKTEMSGLEETIKSVASNSKFSSQEVADAALILGQAGLTAKQVGEALQPVVMLASAAGTSIAQAVDLVTSVIGVFDKNTSDIADIANKITQAANSSKVSVEKLALGFQYAGNAAAASGISFEEVTAAMAAMSNAGIKNGSTMGTGLRQFITETEKPTKEFVASLQRVGLSIADIDFKSNGLIGVAQKLREAGFVASDAIKSFDVRGAAAFNALIANPEELERQFRLLMDTKAGVQANEVQMDSLKAQSTRLTTSLGNLASAGFEPLGKLLTATTSGFATLIQSISEHNVVVGIAGTALAGLAASGAASYLTSMAGGAMRLAAGAGEASAAVLLLQNASKVGSLGTLLTTIGLVSPTATVAAAATSRLAIATNTLKTAFLGLSITTGIGVAIAALTAGYYAYDYIANKTARDIDDLKASTNSAKGAFEEKDAAVKSLSEKIEQLTYRESSLRGNNEAMKTELMAVNSQFGALGVQVDTNNTSFDTMISKLRSLKTEMQEIRKQSLETALAENHTLLQKQVDKASGDVDGYNGKGFFGRNYAYDMSVVMTNRNFKGLSQSAQQKVAAANAQLKAGNLENMTDVPGATLILQKLMAEMRAKGLGDSNGYDRLEGVVTKLIDIGKSITDANTTRADIARQEMTLNRDAAYKGYNESGRFGRSKDGKALTFEDSLPRVGNLEVLARQNQGLSKGASAMEVYDAMRKEQASRATSFNGALEQLRKDSASGSLAPDTYAQLKQMVAARAEKDKNELLETAKATEDEYGLQYDRKKALLMAQKNNPKTKKDKDQLADIERQLTALEVEKANRAEVSPVKALRTTEELNRVRDQKIQNIYDKTDRNAARGPNLNENIAERSLRLQADAKDAEADEIKNSTKTATSMDQLNDMLDKAVAAKIEAKNKRIEALTKKQAKEDEDGAKLPGFNKKEADLSHKLEMKALIDGENSKINSFATSFVSLLETAMTRLDDVTKNINAQKRKIAEDKWQGEDRVFEAQQELRELDLQIATGKKTRGDSKSTVTYGSSYSGNNYTKFTPHGVTVNSGDKTGASKTETDLMNGVGAEITGLSSAIRGTLNQRRNRLVLESTKIELEENEKLLEEYGDDTNGLIGNLNKAYKSAGEKVKIIQAQLAKETDEAKKSVLTAELDAASKQQADSFRDLRQAKGEQKSLRKDNFDIRKRQAENTEALPQEVSLDSLLSKLDEVWDKYQQTVGQMDVMKTIGDGLSSILGGATGQLGNAFASIASGTKSVKDAFRDMATSVIKAMIDIIAQALAMQAVKGILNWVMLGSSVGSGNGGADVGTISAQPDVGALPAATGGLIIPGGIQRTARRMAGGGSVTGGISGRDSVPTMLMPGEFVVKKTAVDAVGTDYLHSLNQASNSVVSSSTQVASQQQQSGGGTVNVWVVSQDQQPAGLGPNDIVVAVSDNIQRGGSIKQLIKSVQTGQI
jgi:TP901 family phage tail tape measure protein